MKEEERNKRRLWQEALAAFELAVTKAGQIQSGGTFEKAREIVGAREDALAPQAPGSASLVVWKTLAEGTLATAESKFREAADRLEECVTLLNSEEVSFLERAGRCEEITPSREVPSQMRSLIGEHALLLIEYGPPWADAA